MLLGIETGYEGKFDFPPRSTGPKQTYVLASVPRTGSTYLSHLMWQTGCLGAPLEYLNFDPAGPYFFAATSAENQSWLWESVVRRRTSPNGVFGVKCFPSQLQQLQEGNPALLSAVMGQLFPQGQDRRVILLNRRDRDAHAISYARAILSGVWRKEQEAGQPAEIEYSEVAIDNARKFLDAQEAAWTAMFRDMRIEPLVMWYEDVVEDPERAVAQAAQFVGVTIDPSAAVKIPVVQPQAKQESTAWIERYSTKADLDGPIERS
jgi:trehalose 2-sulfotransferase